MCSQAHSPSTRRLDHPGLTRGAQVNTSVTSRRCANSRSSDHGSRCVGGPSEDARRARSGPEGLDPADRNARRSVLTPPKATRPKELNPPTATRPMELAPPIATRPIAFQPPIANQIRFALAAPIATMPNSEVGTSIENAPLGESRTTATNPARQSPCPRREVIPVGQVCCLSSVSLTLNADSLSAVPAMHCRRLAWPVDSRVNERGRPLSQAGRPR